jgi:hypothetical protein
VWWPRFRWVSTVASTTSPETPALAPSLPLALVARRFNGVLEQVSLRPFERDRGLKAVVKSYEGGGDFAQLVADLDSFLTENGLYQESDVDIVTAEAIKEEDLRLVCYERLVHSSELELKVRNSL